MTVRKHVDSMRHAMPTTPDPRHDFYDTFNQAGRALMNCADRDPWYHQWSWACEINVTAPIKAGLDYIEVHALSDNPLVSLGQLVRGDLSGSTVDRVVLTTGEHLQALKSNNTARPNVIFLAARVASRPLSSDTPPLERIGIWPPQSADRNDLLLTFQRKWIDVTDDDDDLIPNIPDEWEELLDHLARAKVVEKETQRPAFESVLVINATDMLVNFDAGKQVDDGMPLHSVRRATSTRVGRWFSRIEKP